MLIPTAKIVGSGTDNSQSYVLLLFMKTNGTSMAVVIVAIVSAVPTTAAVLLDFLPSVPLRLAWPCRGIVSSLNQRVHRAMSVVTSCKTGAGRSHTPRNATMGMCRKTVWMHSARQTLCYISVETPACCMPSVTLFQGFDKRSCWGGVVAKPGLC